MNHFAVHLNLTQHCKSAIPQYKIKVKNKKRIRTCVCSGPVLILCQLQTGLLRTAILLPNLNSLSYNKYIITERYLSICSIEAGFY